MSLITRLAGSLVKRGRIEVELPGGRRETLGPGDGKEVALRITDAKALRQLLRKPRLAIGELYMDGRLVIERGSMLDLLEIVVGSNPWEQGGKRGKTALSKGRFNDLKAIFRRNQAAKSRRNVAHHYDLDDRLYDLFLDPMRQYSCAYFTDPKNSLEQAQLDKLAHIAAKLDLKPGHRVLDIGCGWGGLAIYLHRVAGVKVLGVTLSTEQLAYARAWAEREGVADHVKFELIDYRHVTGTFDRIVSVGMFEHVGLAHYDEFYGTCACLLKADGVMLLHTIGKLGGAGSPDPFTDKWIFPGYHLPSLSQMQATSEKHRMIVGDTETLRLHYAYTLRHWLQRCQERRAEIVAIYDERFLRMWEFYLAGGIVMFESGAACNYQVQYIRDRRAVPITRDYLAEAEARYRTLGAPARS
ncbi:cyclopropane-fatty-acyl-phospholipid synthase family protein [Sphingomonas sp. BN140010]|uniref:Cyclopropane-fatty-acyl-phospholipid synthase family protein n=1 Tax=Sphingomonas arvum TaxID=2992113 RepID=A0ABT3JFJ6_9SPHN|nr:cyclopropane-fatty-acyl-phospholipid synthase family protein [Sphingomonas sp. BN140010]MCW3797852.1 cyclopropane-fatty-acyl-phospholipid synthase family protein [Sphingomonas sp. BN140010]